MTAVEELSGAELRELAYLADRRPEATKLKDDAELARDLRSAVAFLGDETAATVTELLDKGEPWEAVRAIPADELVSARELRKAARDEMRSSDVQLHGEQHPKPDLVFESLRDVIAQVDALPAPRHLFRPVWPECDHGMLGAEDKAGKTWMAADASVSTASGTPWLGIYPVDAPGPVLIFVGEGGKRKLVRRIRAICEGRGLRAEDLDIRVCMRVPHLSKEGAMRLVENEVAGHRPSLIIIDPLYLAARGARGSDLYEMGAHLERAQVVAQRHGAALMICHHWNKTGEGRGAKRMTGVGPSAWGRVLASAAVVHRSTDPDTKATAVTLEVEFQGDEIPETTVRIVRKVWADDPEDLASPLHYEVTVVAPVAGFSDNGLRPSTARVLGVLESSGQWETVRTIGDALAAAGFALKTRTIQLALAQLVEAARAIPLEVVGGSAGKWRCARRAQSDDSGDGNAV